MSWWYSGAMVVKGAVDIYSADQTSKDMKGLAGSMAYEPIDLDELDGIIRGLSMRNLEDGIAAEERFRPEFAAMRGEADAAMRERLRTSGRDQFSELRERYMSDLMGEDTFLDMPELQRSELMDASYAQALGDLELGGQLPREIQNQVMRQAMAQGGADRMGTQSGRDIVARDLGLTGMGLRNQRLQTAAGLGQFQTQQNTGQQALRDSINRANMQIGANRRGERAQGLSFLEELGFRDYAAATQSAQGTPLPQMGLDPGSAADIIIADKQAQSAAMQAQAAMLAQASSAKNQGYSDAIGGIAQGLGGLF